MIACDKCGKANMADSKFCRDCGIELSPAPSTVLEAENRKMVSDAQKLFGEGRYDEAALVATAVLENDPDCIEALALRGDCHERLGEYSLSLECYRHILKIQPDSQLDRIRAARLERMIDDEHVDLGVPTARRRTALGAAVATAVLLVSSGSALIIATRQPDSEFATTDGLGVEQRPFYQVAPVPSGSGYSPDFQPGVTNRDLEGIEPVESSEGGIPPLITRDLPLDFSRSVLPGIPSGVIDRDGLGGLGAGYQGNGGMTEEPTRAAATNDGIRDPDPPVVENDDDGNSGMIVDVRGREYIDPTAGSEVVVDANAVKTLIRVARQHFIVGDFAKAASVWEQALKLGASPASTNQRLAQCYEKLGLKAKAITAYGKAIEAFEKLDQDDSLVKASLDSCRQALKLLRSE